MNILGLIPARGGSKGIPGKNSKKLAGKELIRYTVEAAVACQSISRLVVSTDDENIAAISRDAGAEVPFLRPDHLAADNSPTIDTVIHVLDYFKSINIDFDAVCLLQPTTPFRTAEDIDHAVEVFVQSKADSLISVREVPHQYNPHWVFEAVEGSDFLDLATKDQEIIPRRQDLPKAFYRDGAIYITSSAVLLEKQSFYGDKLAYCRFTHSPAINLDTPEDWERAEQWILKGKT